MQYLINTDGQYVSMIDGTSSEIIQQTPEGYTTTVLAPPRSSDYWNGSNWVPIGSAPAYYFKFDYKIKDWVDTRNIEEVKVQKWNQIKLERNIAEFGGFLCDGLPFDSDQISQGRILAAYLFNQPVAWTLANDEVITLSVEQIQRVALSMAKHVQKVHEQARIARVAIKEATTIKEVEAVMFNGK